MLEIIYVFCVLRDGCYLEVAIIFLAFRVIPIVVLKVGYRPCGECKP